ncbi:MAG: RNA methyltransferase [Leptolyngbyaceae cyanobacterium SL_7_1]|nr:RNA methyltransferase [Leptolyngbyaceae cyanobacterium SL_7_1]
MKNTVLNRIRIVLVEPAGGLNVGSIARIMKNMELLQLVVVNPQCDLWGEAARQMAVHAADVLESATVVKTLPEALVGCQRAIATTGRDAAIPDIPVASPRWALPWLLEDASASAALIFGREDRGLTNQELHYAQRLLRIPTGDRYPSLNLAQAVAICCYELHELSGRQQPPIAPTSPTNLAAREQIEAYYEQLESLLLAIGYLYPHTAASRMEKVRRLLNRALPASEEIALLRGMLSQMEWALQTARSSQSDR